MKSAASAKLDGLHARVAGVELGGTKCVCTLAQGGAVVAQATVPTTEPDATLTALADVLTDWWADKPFIALGIASFGPLDLDPLSPGYGQITSTSKSGWQGVDVAGRLGGGFPVPVSIDTDVNGAALAERRWGAGRQHEDFAYVTVGTGVGVGLIVHGRPTRGIGHCEMGHIRVPRLPGDDLPSGCPFHDDCVEGIAAGSAIKLVLGQRSIGAITAADPIWDRVVSALASLCHALLCTTGPTRIVIGGGVVERQPHLIARIETATRTSLAGYLTLPELPLVASPALGDQAGPLGAIVLALDVAGTDTSVRSPRRARATERLAP